MKVTPSKQHKNILGKFRCVLSTEQKEKVKTYLKNMDVAFYGLTIMDLRVLVYEYCTKNCSWMLHKQLYYPPTQKGNKMRLCEWIFEKERFTSA